MQTPAFRRFKDWVLSKAFAEYKLSESVKKNFFRIFTDPHFARDEEGLKYLRLWSKFARDCRDFLLPGLETYKRQVSEAIASGKQFEKVSACCIESSFIFMMVNSCYCA